MAGAVEVQVQDKVIIATGQKANWFKARILVEPKGGLPSTNQFYKDFVLTDHWKNCPSKQPMYGKEVYLYPAYGQSFKKGQRYCDSKTVLEVVDVEKVLDPSEFTGNGHENTVLIVTEVAEADESRKIIVPKTIVPAHTVARSVRHHLKQTSFGGKIVDKNGDCLPRIVSREEYKQLYWFEQAQFWTIIGQGVRFSVRDPRGVYYRRGIVTISAPDRMYAVAYVGIKENQTKDGSIVLAQGADLRELQSLIDASSAEVRELLKSLRPETLAATQRLIEALKQKQ